MSSTLSSRLAPFNQDHVLAFWDQLEPAQQQELQAQLDALDLPLLARLYAQRHEVVRLPPRASLTPLPRVRLDPLDQATRHRGEEAIRQGKVAALMVAGGQGTRLGSDQPKGMFPIGPVTGKSLFQLHAEKVLALCRRYHVALPLLIMTSPATHAETVGYFEAHQHFGLPCVEFFSQGVLPAVEEATGRLLLHAPHRLCLSPNGHGGTLPALVDSGLLAKLRSEGVQTLSYFQVDNPMVRVGDPLFLGYHLTNAAQASTKVVPKRSLADKVGSLVVSDSRCWLIEYSDLPESWTTLNDAQGQPVIWAGSTATHLFDTEFLASIANTSDDGSGVRAPLPFHVARKKVAHLDAKGNLIKPGAPNGLKFEMFIFDILPRAERWTAIEITRDEEYTPLKNATGEASPDSVGRALCEQAARWLEQAGATVPRDPDGRLTAPLEISPLHALEAGEVRLPSGATISRFEPFYLS